MNAAPLASAGPVGQEAPAGWTLRLVRDTGALADLQVEWDALWARSPGASLFARHAWFANWWHHFGRGPGRLPFHRPGGQVELPWQGARLAVLTARDGHGVLRAVAPWLVARGAWRRVPVHMLCGPLNAHAPRTDLLADCAAAAAVAGCWPLRAAHGEWDLVLCDGHAEGNVPAQWNAARSVAAGATDAGPAASAPRLLEGGAWRHLVLPLQADFDALLAARGSHFRKRERQAARALTELGAVTVACVRTPDAAARAFERFVAVDAASWKAVSGEALAAHPRLAAYYRDMVRRHAVLGACDLWVLALAGTPAAAAIVLRAGATAHVIKLSHARALASARHAPARVLLARIIEAACAEGLKTLDFTGDMPFVERWSDTALSLRAVGMFCATPRGRLAWLAERAAQRLAGWRAPRPASVAPASAVPTSVVPTSAATSVAPEPAGEPT